MKASHCGSVRRSLGAFLFGHEAAIRHFPGSGEIQVVGPMVDVTAAFDDQRLQAPLAQLLGNPAAADARADDNCVEVHGVGSDRRRASDSDERQVGTPGAGYELVAQLLGGADFGLVITEQHEIFELAVADPLTSIARRRRRASPGGGVPAAAREPAEPVPGLLLDRFEHSDISSRVVWEPQSSSMSRMKAALRRRCAPGVSVGGNDHLGHLLEQRELLGGERRALRALAIGGPAAKRVSAAAPPTQEHRAQQQGAPIEFCVVDRFRRRRLLRPDVSAKLPRTGCAMRAPRHISRGAHAKGLQAAATPCRAKAGDLDGGAGRHRRRLDVGDGRVGGLLERHRFPGGSLGDQFAQQVVVQLVAGLVAAELADQAVPE